MLMVRTLDVLWRCSHHKRMSSANVCKLEALSKAVVYSVQFIFFHIIVYSKLLSYALTMQT